MIALNLGSGQRPFKPPWLNYDIQEVKWKGYTEERARYWVDEPWERHYDISCLHHVIEHFGCGEADDMIRKCYDYLKEDGSLLVFVPDLRLLAQRWLTHQLDTQLMMTQIHGAFMGDEADRHKWGFDKRSLTEYLEKFGWSQVKPFDWREIEGADIARDFYICGMECVK